MNFADRLFFLGLTGCVTRASLDAHLESIARRVFAQAIVTKEELATWDHPRVQEYFKWEMQHVWRAYGAGGSGQLEIGRADRMTALATLSRTIPKSAVLSVDDVCHFIFFKLTE